MIDIAANIKRLRKLKNLSSKEPATGIDIAETQYSIIEGCKVLPATPTLEKITDKDIAKKRMNDNLKTIIAQ